MVIFYLKRAVYDRSYHKIQTILRTFLSLFTKVNAHFQGTAS